MGVLRFFKMYSPIGIISGAIAFLLSNELEVAAILGVVGGCLLVICSKEIGEVVKLADNDRVPDWVKEQMGGGL